MNGGDAAPFEDDVQRGTPDPGLKHLRKIDLSADEQAEYASKCKEWLPGTHDCGVQDFENNEWPSSYWCFFCRTERKGQAAMCNTRAVLEAEMERVFSDRSVI